MDDKRKAEELTRVLDAVLQGGELVDQSLDEEVRSLSEVGQALYDAQFEVSAVHRAAVERLLQNRREEILEAATGTKRVQTKPATEKRPTPRWLVPAVAGGLVFVFLCAALAVVAVGGAAWWLTRDRAQETVVAELPSTTVEVGPSTPRPTVGSVPDVVAPARLRSQRGLVEMQSDDGTWIAVESDQPLEEGTTLRTGALSGAEILFYDGSVATLGPDTEVSLDHISSDADQARVIEMTQWVGESTHDVVPSSVEGARYAVDTPNGEGEAKGTVFHVLVSPVMVAQFIVDEGTVAVTNIDVTVLVVAGQSTLIPLGEPPAEPVFRISGEGQVTQTGVVWKIAGYPFETHDGTVIVGNPQVGDWVLVDGHRRPEGTRVADRIVLLYRSSVDRFSISGEVEAIAADEWTVAGQTIAITDTTVIEDEIQVEEDVLVRGTIDAEGTLWAESIRRLVSDPGLEFAFVGTVQAIEETTWTISGVTVTVDSETDAADWLDVGDVVAVRGQVVEDGVWLARSIQPLTTEELAFEFTGILESMAPDPWIVSGISFETGLLTEVEQGLEVDDRVKVEGRVLPDGTWLADEIKSVDDDEELSFEFVGTVEQIEPTWWVVNGISLTVDAAEIEDGIAVGDLVKVEGQITPDGEWLATEIKKVNDAVGTGCVKLIAVVFQAEGNTITLPDGVDIQLEDSIIVEGDPVAGAVIEVWICVDGDGHAAIVSIVVISYVNLDDIVVVVPPTQPPAGEKVTICHKPGTKAEQTKQVPRDALSGHLGHGDTLGPCQ